MRKTIEHVHWPDAPDLWMPYAPAIKVKGGTTVYLAGVTAAPVYHHHPHRPEEFDNMPRDMEGQARAALDNLRRGLSIQIVAQKVLDGLRSQRPFIGERLESERVCGPADGDGGVGQLQQAQERHFVCVTRCGTQLDSLPWLSHGLHGWSNDRVLRSAATSI
jgi:hypothetical protein